MKNEPIRKKKSASRFQNSMVEGGGGEVTQIDRTD